MKIDIDIENFEFGINAIVTYKGYQYYMPFAKGSNVTVERIKKEWKENRREFLPYYR